MWRDEQHPGAGGGKPAGEQLCGALGGEGLAEQHLEPAPDVAQLGGTAAEQRDDGTASLRRAQEVRDRVNPLSEDVGPYPGLVVQEGTLVWVGGRSVHARAKVDEHALLAVLALDHRRRRIGPEAGSVDQVVLRENPDRGGPLDRRQRLVERAADGVVVCEQPRRLACLPRPSSSGSSAACVRRPAASPNSRTA